MIPAYPSLADFSWELAVVRVLLFLFIGILIGAGALQLATKWVAGFTPSLGRACGAFICAIVLGLIVGAFAVRLAGPDSRVILLMIPIGLFLEACWYQAVLARGDVAEEISVIQGVLISILQRLIILVPLFFIVMSAALLIGMSKVQRIMAQQGTRGLSPSGANTRSAPAYATVADAQQEAVRRYPQLAVQGSRLNKAYVDRYHLYQKTWPSYFADNSWPVRLADETANDLASW